MDVELPSREGAFEIQQEMGQWVHSQLKPILEEVFDELAPKDQIIRLDKLEIDLGSLSSGNFKESISNSLKEKLKFSIRKQLSQQTDRLTPQVKLPRHIIAQQAIEIFLLQGFLPWWTPHPALSLLMAEISPAISPSWAQACFQLASEHTHVLKRLIEQFSEDFIFDLGQAARPDFPSKALFEELKALNFFQSKTSSPTLPKERHFFWQAVAPVLASGKSRSREQGFTSFLEEWVQLQLIEGREKLPEGLIYRAQKLRSMDAQKTYPLFSALVKKDETSPLFQSQFWQYVMDQEEPPVPGDPVENLNPKKSDSASLKSFPQKEKKAESSLTADDHSPDFQQVDRLEDHQSKMNQDHQERIEHEKSSSPSLDNSSKQETAPFQNQESSHSKATDDEKKEDNKQPRPKEDAIIIPLTHQETSGTLLDKLYKKFYTDLHPNSSSSTPSRDQIPEEGIYVNLAGLVLLHPFLAAYLTDQQLIMDGQFVNEKARETAAYHLAFLATGQNHWEEQQLIIPKLLCGISFEKALDATFDLSDKAKAEADKLLRAVINHWGALGSSSPDGLREGFLMREGRLRYTDDNGWMLKVAHRTMDVLMGKLPWGVGYVKLDWLEELIRVEW